MNERMNFVCQFPMGFHMCGITYVVTQILFERGLKE